MRRGFHGPAHRGRPRGLQSWPGGGSRRPWPACGRQTSFLNVHEHMTHATSRRCFDERLARARTSKTATGLPPHSIASTVKGLAEHVYPRPEVCTCASAGYLRGSLIYMHHNSHDQPSPPDARAQSDRTKAQKSETRCHHRPVMVMVMVMVLNSAYTGPLPRYL